MYDGGNRADFQPVFPQVKATRTVNFKRLQYGMRMSVSVAALLLAAYTLTLAHAQSSDPARRPENPSERKARSVVENYLACWQEHNYVPMYQAYTYKPRGKRLPFTRWKELAERIDLVKYEIVGAHQRLEYSVAVDVRLVMREKGETREETRQVIVSKVDKRNRPSKFGAWKISALTIFPYQ